MKKFLTLILLLNVLIINACTDDRIAITTPSGKELILEIANTPELRQKGLMYRKKLRPDSGMIFLFNDNEIRYFWMKNTLIALSIAFLDTNGVVVHTTDMYPEDLSQVSSIVPARMAIEINQGMLEDYGFIKGARLELPKNILHEVK